MITISNVMLYLLLVLIPGTPKAEAIPYGLDNVGDIDLVATPPVIGAEMSIGTINHSNYNVTFLIFYGLDKCEWHTQYGTVYVKLIAAVTPLMVLPYGRNYSEVSPVPPDPNLEGLSAYFQAIGVMVGNRPAFSNGMELKFGY